MDGETKMNGNGRYHTKLPNVAGSVSDLTQDVIELTELQTQLFVLDVKKSVAKARACFILAVVGACLLLGSIPVALFAVAELLHEQLAWSRAAGFGVATLIGLLLCATVLGFAWTYVKSGLVSLDQSREELRRNISWLKSTLRNRSQRHAAEKPLNY
jgi:hypothetical protein